MRYTYGFLDSGIGGLPYMQELRKVEPTATCAYVADDKHFPYGEKTSKEICQYATETTKKLIAHFKPSVVIVACNTISVVALEHLRNTFSDILFVGTVPAIKTAAEVSKNHKIGLLGTTSTVNSEYTKKLIDEFANDCEVVLRADTALIAFIEKHKLSATKEERRVAIMPAIAEFREKGVDTVVLGCTHFLQYVEDFKEVAPEIAIVDSREGVINQALRLASQKKNIPPLNEKGEAGCSFENNFPHKKNEPKDFAVIYSTKKTLEHCDNGVENSFDDGLSEETKKLVEHYEATWGGYLE